MKDYWKIAGIAILAGLCLLPVNIAAVEITGADGTVIDIEGRAQEYGMLEFVDDKHKDTARVLLFVKEARLKVSGMKDTTRFGIEMGLGAEAADLTSSDVTALLYDAWGDVKLTDNLYVRGGQFKVPYSRERLADGGSLQFTNRSINTKALNIGRETGVAFHGNSGKLTGALGIFTGGGINQRVRNIPVRLGFPMTVVRIGLNDLDEDIFNVKALNEEKEGSALYVNALYMKNSRVGHSNILGMRQVDSSFLLSSGWNPYLTGNWGTELIQAGADYALHKKLSDDKLLTLNAEVNHGTFASDTGRLDVTAGTVQAGVKKSSLELATRFSLFIPDEAMKNGSGEKLFEDGGVQIITPAINYYLNDNVKILMDLPIMLNAPIVTETGNGQYNLIYQPGQTSYVNSAQDNYKRRTAITGRMVMQIAF